MVAVDAKGGFGTAYARKINDSGEGIAYLIYGGEWGIRLRPQSLRDEPWDFKNPHQWGEPYKVYGRKEDLIFKNTSESSPS